MQAVELTNVCDGLLFRIFPSRREENEGCVIALASVHPGAGVTQLTNALAEAVRRCGDESAVSLCCRYLKIGDSGPGFQESVFSTLQAIRHRRRYAFIDCGAMATSQDIVRLAPLVDGVILVVEANRTQREQIEYAERTIEAVNGRILGFILNKRTYVVPEWCHRVMTSVGL